MRREIAAARLHLELNATGSGRNARAAARIRAARARSAGAASGRAREALEFRLYDRGARWPSNSLAAGAAAQSDCRLLIGCLLVCAQAWADIDVEIKGVNDELRRNVLTYLSFERYKKRAQRRSRYARAAAESRRSGGAGGARSPSATTSRKSRRALRTVAMATGGCASRSIPGKPVIIDESRRAGARARGA